MGKNQAYFENQIIFFVKILTNDMIHVVLKIGPEDTGLKIFFSFVIIAVSVVGHHVLRRLPVSSAANTTAITIVIGMVTKTDSSEIYN